MVRTRKSMYKTMNETNALVRDDDVVILKKLHDTLQEHGASLFRPHIVALSVPKPKHIRQGDGDSRLA